ncbi:hypothetical protein FOCC_FOCC003145 [Frankliniella occidentalis]|uniref:Transportin-3 n=1 Tax=Frankliniella occidentalis TaxID=133901 RepID=A0A6J1SST8_FRAOC|nr:transportin-3 [Frankliniella occidentalis]KAE8750021.1 hypothetical protein FOCC_FOCC003145 [Frankliniella occidentalis]
MDSSPSLETVYQAVYTLYHNPDPAEKEKASQWLGELQKSVSAWNISNELLQQQHDLESCYFAAQTMRTKIQLSFHELPVDVHESLRDSLISHIRQVTDTTNTVIVTQLCLALADLALQMSTWTAPVSYLINHFQHNLWPLLETLTVLPEEVNSRTLRLGSNRRQEILNDFQNSSPAVLQFLKACLTNGGENPQIHIRILRCFSSWVSIQAITLSEVLENIVVVHAFQILSNPSSPSGLHEAASDCVCALLLCLEENNDQPQLEQHLFQGVMSLEEAYHQSVATEDQEKSMNYCRIFTELAESFKQKMVAGCTPSRTHFALKILDLVLTCVGHHDYEVAEITFNLWYRLSEELYVKNLDTLTVVFKPYVERLIAALCHHCQMEPDHDGLLDEGDDFQDFRIKVSELIKDVVFIVGSSNCFRQMFINLQVPGVTWDASEAALFVMQSVAKNILPEENDVVPKVVEAILNLPENTHLAVRHTSLLLLGELCEWIEYHPQSLEPVLNFLLYCLQRPPLASAAAVALQAICSACCEHMGVHFNGLIQIVQSLDTFNMSNQAAIGLLKGVAVILGRLPTDQITPRMKEICFLQVQPLCELLESDVKVQKATRTDPVYWLDRLAVIFRNTSPSVQNGTVHPCRDVLTEVWPVLSKTCDKYQEDSRVMERVCRCLRYAVRCVGKQAAHLLEPLVKQMVSLYVQHQHSCCLYLGSILVDEYASESGCVVGLLEMLEAFIGPTFTILQEGGWEKGLRDHPDTVDDLFRLCARFLQRAPVPFLQCNSLQGIISCALLAVTLDHRYANASVMKFFYDLIHCGRNNESKEDFATRQSLVLAKVRENGQILTARLLHASVFYLHSYMLSDVADVIVELIQTDGDSMNSWLQQALEELNTNAQGHHLTATSQQIVDFHATIMKAEGTKQVTYCLKDFTRLFR